MPTIKELTNDLDGPEGEKLGQYVLDKIKIDLNKFYREEHTNIDETLALEATMMMFEFSEDVYNVVKRITYNDLKKIKFSKMEQEYQTLLKMYGDKPQKVKRKQIAKTLIKYHLCKKVLEDF